MKLQVKGLTKETMDKKVKGLLGDTSTSKSYKIKELFRLGLEVKEISQLMGIRYNFAYNVISNMVIVEGLDVVHEETISKRDIISQLSQEGNTPKEIAVKLKTNLNYIYKVLKETKEEKEGIQGVK